MVIYNPFSFKQLVIFQFAMLVITRDKTPLNPMKPFSYGCSYGFPMVLPMSKSFPDGISSTFTIGKLDLYKVWLMVSNIFIFPYIGNVIIPIDFHIFQRGRLNHQPDP